MRGDIPGRERRNGKPVGRIIREETPKAKPPGSMRGRVKVMQDARLIDESTTLG